MDKQIVYDRWVIVDTTQGTVCIPQEYVGKTTQPTAKDVADYIDGEFISAEIIDGYGARLSMPGYLDCTEWTVFETREAAKQHLAEMFNAE